MWSSNHSHSMVPGGFEVRSRARPDIPSRASMSCLSSATSASGSCAGRAVIALLVCTGRSTTSSFPLPLIDSGTIAVGHCQIMS